MSSMRARTRSRLLVKLSRISSIDRMAVHSDPVLDRSPLARSHQTDTLLHTLATEDRPCRLVRLSGGVPATAPQGPRHAARLGHRLAPLGPQWPARAEKSLMR